MSEKVSQMTGKVSAVALKEIREKVSDTCSILGMALIVVGVINVLLEFALVKLARQFSWSAILNLSEWGNAMMIIEYIIFLPLMNKVLAKVPEKKAQIRKMSIGSIILVFIVSTGICESVSILGSFINSVFSVLTGKSAAQMDPVSVALDNIKMIDYFYVCLIAPIVEEYIFRKKLLDRLRPYGDKAAILYTAVMFGLMHGNLKQSLYTCCFGLIVGYIAIHTGTIRYTIIIHIMFNMWGQFTVLCVANPNLSVVFALVWMSLMCISLVAAIIIFKKRKQIIQLGTGDLPEGVQFRDIALSLFANPGSALFILCCVSMVLIVVFMP